MKFMESKNLRLPFDNHNKLHDACTILLQTIEKLVMSYMALSVYLFKTVLKQQIKVRKI